MVNIVAKEHPQDSVYELEASTMEIIHQIANTIHQSIKITVDYPSKCSSYRLLVLDAELWLETKDNKLKILHSLYAKSMATKYLAHKNAAIADNGKFNILIEELMRVMRHVSCMCDPSELQRRTQHYIYHMQFLTTVKWTGLECTKGPELSIRPS